MKQIFIVLMIILKSTLIQSQESTLDFARSLPNPRTQNSSWILDQTKLLESSGTKETLNQILEKLEKDTTNEVSIVILPTIGTLVPKNLATEIFQTWGIGKLGKDNGVLILHVLDQRRIEIEIGYGLEGILTDVLCKRLLEEKTIPYFKTGAYSSGHENLIRTIDQILRDKKKSPTNVIDSYKSALPNPEKANVDIIPEELLILLDPELNKKREWRIYSIISFLIGLLLIYLYRFLLYRTSKFWKTKYESEKKREEFFASLSVFAYGFTTILITTSIAGFSYSFFGLENLVFAIVFPVITIIVLTGYLAPRMYRKWENFLLTAPRICSKCKSNSIQIQDNNDVYRLLTEEERFEQKLRTYNFSIYECTKCNHIDKIKSYGINFGNYRTCSSCNTYAATESFKTISEATENAEGLEEITVTCRKCGFISSNKSKTPKIYKSSASTSKPNSQSNSSYHSDSSSSSNSSSDSSKDYGGGSSGGGGAGSSY